MKHSKKEVEYKSWHLNLFLAVIFVSIVLGIVQRFNQDEVVGEPLLEDDSAIMSEFTCKDSGGLWDSCGSACRSERADDPQVICAEVCVEHCYCMSGNECPHDHHCDNFIENIGLCVIN